MSLRRYIGDRAFYRRLSSIMIPMLVQNLITNFVSLLDNTQDAKAAIDQLHEALKS